MTPIGNGRRMPNGNKLELMLPKLSSSRSWRAAQQPLDVEFKRVLFDNLWELYAR